MNRKSIPRQTVAVTITLSDGRNMRGTMQFDLDIRLSDFINGPERFIVFRDLNGELRIINKEHIVDMLPEEED